MFGADAAGEMPLQGGTYGKLTANSAVLIIRCAIRCDHCVSSRRNRQGRRLQTGAEAVAGRGNGKGAGLKIYNTMTGMKEAFVPLEAGKVGMYACGVTVYDYCHVGHARSCNRV